MFLYNVERDKVIGNFLQLICSYLLNIHSKFCYNLLHHKERFHGGPRSCELVMKNVHIKE